MLKRSSSFYIYSFFVCLFEDFNIYLTICLFFVVIMPFSKWNLEPVYVSRAPPWSHLQHYHHHHHQQHQVLKSTTTNNNVINDSSLTTATTTNVQQTSTTTTTTTTNSETISLPPFVLKLSSIEDDTNRRDENRSTDDVDDEGGGRSDDIDSIEETTTNDDDTQRELSTKCESILLKIECRTMVGIVRQMAALLGAADQQFAEIVDECRKLTERSTLLRSRVVKLSGNVDRANLAIRQSRKSPFFCFFCFSHFSLLYY